MKRILSLIMVLILAMSVCAFAESQPEEDAAIVESETAAAEGESEAQEEAAPEPTKEPGRLAGISIGIDPGHQEHQNSAKELVSPKGKEKKAKVAAGTSGRKTKIPEYKTNLEVSLKLRDLLEAEGARVVMTRETNNVDISNYERAMMMNKAGVDLVLRIHCNGVNKHSVHGAATYVRKSIAYNNKIVPDPKTLLKAEADAAGVLIRNMCETTGAKNLGVMKRDTYTMNNWSTVPIILVEMGYMTNDEEDVKLNDPDYQWKLAQGMVNGIAEYFGR